MATKRLKMVCDKCGSEDVLRDATAAWNEATQDWELAGVQDQGYCEGECEGECTIKEVEIM